MAADQSKADWLFFLDADDRMYPYAFKSFEKYKDYDAVWGNIWELVNGVCAWRYQVPLIKDYKELIAHDPYYTVQMGHFVRRDKFEGFDEDMDCGEDFKYYLKMWKSHNCIKVGDCFFLNQRGANSIGPRSASGAEWTEVVGRLISEARNEYIDNR